MNNVIGALQRQQDELSGLVSTLQGAGLARPSRCPGWSVSDVLLHLAQTNELAIASTQGRLRELSEHFVGGFDSIVTVDEWAAKVVERERGSAAEAIRDRWLESAHGQLAAFGACDPHARVQWVAGEMSARSLATTRLAETWIHTVDVAWGLNVELRATERLWHIARLAWRTLPYAFARAERHLTGPVSFELRGPNGEMWRFARDEMATASDARETVIRGAAIDLCTVAGQRAHAADTPLTGDGPDAEAVLTLVRTFA